MITISRPTDSSKVVNPNNMYEQNQEAQVFRVVHTVDIKAHTNAQAAMEYYKFINAFGSTIAVDIMDENDEVSSLSVSAGLGVEVSSLSGKIT